MRSAIAGSYGYQGFYLVGIAGFFKASQHSSQLIYAGTNAFRTRDYRYLGTIGFFDSLYLNLKQGDNEVLFTLKEGFGGWGMKAKIDDQSGLHFE
ncbi:MAG: hypothetical protein P8L44_20185 [Opitutales bacterium]|jgi:hypothetical protein|nr:hypothetical protein [Opitutales bacterium]